ncbi:Short-chain dehydrogenase/reductase SDR [Penicillium cf. viridicatum]|uniref:Short-chain dehydrogenase/reductase SDR n=1 Tax=Penicillium cf. viridicatum TaxID=2972119 RepID=A0A9W9ML53_9EURO|nr:Short-chain dehydrogenase/reductase SDR [Penicillium cf. viridicatum]
MTLFPGVALITGAASGIGRATALAFTDRSKRWRKCSGRDDRGRRRTARVSNSHGSVHRGPPGTY